MSGLPLLPSQAAERVAIYSSSPYYHVRILPWYVRSKYLGTYIVKYLSYIECLPNLQVSGALLMEANRPNFRRLFLHTPPSPQHLRLSISSRNETILTNALTAGGSSDGYYTP